MMWSTTLANLKENLNKFALDVHEDDEDDANVDDYDRISNSDRRFSINHRRSVSPMVNGVDSSCSNSEGVKRMGELENKSFYDAIKHSSTTSCFCSTQPTMPRKKYATRSTKHVSNSQVDQINNDSKKKRKTETGSEKVGDVNGNGVDKRHSDFTKEEFVQGYYICNNTNGWISETESNEYSQQTVGLWHGNAVGLEIKEFLQAVENRYPTTFEGVQMRSVEIWVPVLKHFHVVIKRFIETSVDAFVGPHITTLHVDLKEFERSGFDLSWAHQRLNMVEMIKCEDDPLRKELTDLQESLQTLNKTLVDRLKEFVEAYDMFKKVRLAYDNTNDARNEKVREVAQKFGVEYDRVLKGPVGFEMLPGY